MTVELHLADCREVMREMEPDSVDAIVSDPPYELNFMGANWDASGIAFDRTVWTEAYRVLKPGGYVLASGATRTWHWLACALELSGFESRGSIAWIQGQGMQHGLDISKAMDADVGAEREAMGKKVARDGAVRRPQTHESLPGYGAYGNDWDQDITAPATDEAKRWAGWGTQLAPKHEPIAMFRKPLDGTYVENVRAHGVGGLNVDACRLEGGADYAGGKGNPTLAPAAQRALNAAVHGSVKATRAEPHNLGRWPPNVALDEAAAAQLDAMVGKRTSGARTGKTYSDRDRISRLRMGDESTRTHSKATASEHGPSAFFFCPKSPTGERDKGCEHLRWVRDDDAGWRLCEAGEEPDIVGSCHSTVKPLALMRWLVRLVTPPGGLVFDPFLGSGTTGVAAVCEGMSFVGSDITPWAFKIAEARIRWAQGYGPTIDDVPDDKPIQASLFR